MPITKIGDNTGDTAGIQDIYLAQNVPDEQNGALNRFYVGNWAGAGSNFRALLRFNLSSIAAGIRINAATLYLYDNNWPGRTANCTVNIYRISEANKSWVEGGTGSAVAGWPNWNWKIHNTAAWAGSAGCSTVTTDYNSTAWNTGGTLFTDGTSGYKAIELNSTALSDIESWLGSSNGAGVILTGSTSAGTYTEIAGSVGTDGRRPYLELNYSPRTWGPFAFPRLA